MKKLYSHQTKQEVKLYNALRRFIGNSVNFLGSPKRATETQVRKAEEAIREYDEFVERYK